MDKRDLALLEALQADARASLADLGLRIGLSISATNERIRKLVAIRMIRSWSVRVDAARLGYPILAFAEATLENPGDEPMFLAAVMVRPEVQECFPLASDRRYMLKLRARDKAELESLADDFLRRIPGVAHLRLERVRTIAKDGEYIPCLPPAAAADLRTVG
jgi:Lrp/AsnC family transcriptional regulator, leucine-responsive regulatory protein